MIDGTYRAILLSAKDYKENDKLLRLLTVEGGIITAVMRGVKKPSAKLRFGAVPFAFCEYTLCQRGALPLVIGCNQIENLFGLADNFDAYAAGYIMMEVAGIATGCEANADIFVSLLKSLKLVLYSQIDPNLVAVRFIQKIIHDSGYAYVYSPPTKEIRTELELLSLLDHYGLDEENEALYKEYSGISTELIVKTLCKIISNFEKKFEEKINSAKLLVI